MYRNIFVFVLFALLASAICKPAEDKFEQLNRECEDEVECHNECVLTGAGWFKADGTIDEEVAIANIPDSAEKEKLASAVSACARESKRQTNCETAEAVLECIDKITPETPEEV